MTTKDEALKLALEALEEPKEHIAKHRRLEAITAIKEVLAQAEHQSTADKSKLEKVPAKGTLLAQPEQEPVAHLWECLGRWSAYLANNGMQAECAPPSWLVDAIKKATTPPQRTWVGLTDEEIMEMLGFGQYGRVPQYARNFVDAIEAKLKEKNMTDMPQPQLENK